MESMNLSGAGHARGKSRPKSRNTRIPMDRAAAVPLPQG